MKPRDRFEALRRHRRAGEGLALLLFLLLSLIAHRSTLFAGRIDPGAGAPGGQQEVARLGGIPSYLAGEFGKDAERGRYRPLAPMVYALEVALFRDRSFAYRAARILVHLLSALLVLQIGKRLFGRLVPAAIVAALFAIHPLLHEVKPGMDGLSILLSLFFGLAAWLAAGGEKERPWWTPFLLFLSMMASEVGALWAAPIVAETVLLRRKRELGVRAAVALILAAFAAYAGLRLLALGGSSPPPPAREEAAAPQPGPDSPAADTSATEQPPPPPRAEIPPRLREAQALRTQDLRADAIRVLGRMVNGDPADREARLLLGEILFEHGMTGEALLQFDAAEALGNEDARALHGEARCYDRLGRREEAERCYRRALRVDPDLEEAAMRVGVIALGRGENAEARDFLRRVTGGRNHYPALIYLAQASEALGDFREAERAYAEAARLAPRDPSPWVHWARMLLRRGERNEAREKLEYDAHLAPEDPIVQRLLTEVK